MTNNQRKKTFLEVTERITREEFINKLTELGREETLQFFNLGLANFASLVHFYECENILEEQAKLRRKLTFEARAREKLAQLCDKVSAESLKNYYIDENHSLQDTRMCGRKVQSTSCNY